METTSADQGGVADRRGQNRDSSHRKYTQVPSDLPKVLKMNTEPGFTENMPDVQDPLVVPEVKAEHDCTTNLPELDARSQLHELIAPLKIKTELEFSDDLPDSRSRDLLLGSKVKTEPDLAEHVPDSQLHNPFVMLGVTAETDFTDNLPGGPEPLVLSEVKAETGGAADTPESRQICQPLQGKYSMG